MDIKILHTGDIHLGDLSGPTRDGENLRRLDTLACMDAIVSTAQAEKPDITVIAGDLFNRSRVWADTALEDVNDAITRFLRPLCAASNAVVLLFGTENHDNPRAFEVIGKTTRDLPNLRIYTTPTVEIIETVSGPVQILAVPGFDRGRLRTFCPGADKETENQNATTLVNQIILGLAAQLRPEIPSILTAHYTVAGCTTESGQSFLAGQDVVVTPDTIDATGATLACFGHIHRPQRLPSNIPAYYCGSPNQLTFNDEGMEHGFWTHTIQGEPVMVPHNNPPIPYVNSLFIPTPERKHFTLRIGAEEVTKFLSSGSVAFPTGIKDAIVRVRYSCTTEQEKAFNRAELQRAIMQAGAFHVAELLPEEIEELDASDYMTEHDGPPEALKQWLKLNEIAPLDQNRLMALAAPILSKADDGRNANQHSGAFIPVSISVHNYRSYTDATFDFSPVRMAMVNGSNGVGKSSLFMDALADCLFEQSRQEDIGGWVRDGTKSGSITFTFQVGGNTYRVIRTRMRSGKGTLSLQVADGDTWNNAGDTTMKLTQQKIIRLMGMDCATFCSIALIRQDAYGIFLDASSDHRMEVLSALLGLDLYDRAEDMAKAGAKEYRAKIAECNTRTDILSGGIAEKSSLEGQAASLSSEKESLEGELGGIEAGIQAIRDAEAVRLAAVQSAEAADKRSASLSQQLGEKRSALQTAQRSRDEAQNGASLVEAARSASQKAAAARRLVDMYAGSTEKYEDNRRRAGEAQAELDGLTPRITAAQAEITAAESILRDGDAIRAQYAQLQEIRTQKGAVAQRAAEQQTARNDLSDLILERNMTKSQWTNTIQTIEGDISRARSDSALLLSSGCPVVGTAGCKFLAGAYAARDSIPSLEAKLAEARTEARQKYDELTGLINAAKENPILAEDIAQTTKDLEAQERSLAGIEGRYAQLGRAEERKAAAVVTMEDLIQRQETAKTKLDAVNAEAGLLRDYSEKLDAAKRDLAAWQPLADQLPQYEAAAAKIEALGTQIAELGKDIATLERQHEEAVTEAQRLRSEIPFADDATLGRLTARRTEILSRIQAIASTQGTIVYKLGKIAEDEAAVEQLRRERASHAATLTDYQTLTKAFSLDGIRYMIVRSIVPEIMRRSNEILNAMTGGRMSVDIRTEHEKKSDKKIINALEVWIHTIDGGNRPYQSHSGGEKVKIALAVTLGLADVKARRAGVQLGMLFIDEPPFLDADGTDAYADALTAMAARNPNMRILAISHDPTMKARFPQNITVKAGENGSSVTME